MWLPWLYQPDAPPGVNLISQRWLVHNHFYIFAGLFVGLAGTACIIQIFSLSTEPCWRAPPVFMKQDLSHIITVMLARHPLTERFSPCLTSHRSWYTLIPWCWQCCDLANDCGEVVLFDRSVTRMLDCRPVVTHHILVEVWGSHSGLCGHDSNTAPPSLWQPLWKTASITSTH